MIIVDSNEPKDIVASLQNAGMCREVKDLPFGDYWIESTSKLPPLIIERKTINDLLSSIRDGRIFDQLKAIKNFKEAESRLLIEGDFYVLKFRRWAEKSLTSLLWSIENDWNVQISHARNKHWTISWLVRWAKQRMGLESPKRVHPVRFVQKTGDLKYLQRGLIEGLPLVSGELAERLLNHFKKPINVFNATIDQLQVIKGIGQEKAEKIRKVLETEYTSKGGEK